MKAKDNLKRMADALSKFAEKWDEKLEGTVYADEIQELAEKIRNGR